MTKRRIVTTLLLLIVTIFSLSALTACKKRKFVPKVQGSAVMTIDNQDINGMVVSSYDKFSAFNSSEYANMKLNGFDFVAKKSFYTREFFRAHNLIAVKFNDWNNAKFFINNINVRGNKYDVDIVRLENSNNKNKKIQSYALFLEVPEKYNVKDAIVDLHFNKDKKVESLSDAARSNITSKNPLEVAIINNAFDMQHYIKESDSKTAEMLSKFDSMFFKNNVLCIADFTRFDKSTVVVEYIDNTLLIEVFNTDHYAKDTDRMGRMVKFMSVPRGTYVDNVKLINYWECDFDKTYAPETFIIDFKTPLSEKAA